jgi:hypothetical protein
MNTQYLSAQQTFELKETLNLNSSDITANTPTLDYLYQHLYARSEN